MAPASDDIGQLLDQIRRLQEKLSEFGVSPAAKSGSLLIWPDASTYDTVQRTPDLLAGVAEVGLFAARPEAEFSSGSDGSFQAKAVECSNRIMDTVFRSMQNADTTLRINLTAIQSLSQSISAVAELAEERDSRMFDQFVHSQVNRIPTTFERSSQSLMDTLDNLYTSLNLILDLNVMVAASKGSAAQKQKAAELKDAISRLTKLQPSKQTQPQYTQELQNYLNAADKRFAEAAARTPDGQNYLGSLIGWKLSTSAAMGVPILLQRQSNIRRLTKIDVNAAVLQAASTPNQDRINQITKGREAVKARVDKLSDPVLMDGEHIRSLLLIFTKVLVGGNGGPNWNEISQDVSASKSDWAYLRTELTALSKATYGSSSLGVEGKAIVEQANKLADEIKSYSDKQTDGRVNQIVSEVDALKVRANKLSIAISLQSGKIAVPILTGNSPGPTTNNPQFASRAVQTLALQSSVIVAQLEASRDLFSTVSQSKNAKLDVSRNFVKTLDTLSQGADWNLLEGVLLEAILILAETLLQFQEFYDFNNIAVASAQSVLLSSLDALGRTLQSDPNESKLGDVSQSEYQLRTSLNHFVNLTSVAMTLNRFLKSYVEASRMVVEPSSRLAMELVQNTSIRGLDEEALSRSNKLLEQTRGAIDRLGSINEATRSAFEGEASQLEGNLQDGQKVLEASLSGVLDTVKNEYVSEVNQALSVV